MFTVYQIHIYIVRAPVCRHALILVKKGFVHYVPYTAKNSKIGNQAKKS